MKKSLILVGMLSIGYAYAQEGSVGINTETPKATLEIVPNATNLAGTTNEGIIIPKLTKARVVAIAADKLVEGTKVYVTDEVTAADTQFIGAGKGFYFYNGTKWVKQLTSDATAIAAQNIYNTDGTLTDNRIVNLDNKRITFDGEGKVRVGSIENENSSAKFGVITPLDNGAVKNTFFLAPNLLEGNSTHITVGKTFGRNNNGSIDFVYRGNNSNKNGIALNTDGRTNGYILFAQADGNVGINTDNPVRKLDVVGGARFAGENGGFSVWMDATADTGVAIHRFRRNNSPRWDVGMDGNADTDTHSGSNYYISSAQNDGSTFARRLTILRENGNVGIGNTNPTEKLDVNGNVKANAFLGANGATIFPDYVFQKYYTGTSSIKSDYSFKTLSQVEDFVKTNGHLPGYKSAETIKAQGYVDLMETQLTNVEKIEELYLHSIEQDKAIKEKDAKIQALEARLEKLEKLLK